MTRRLAIKVHPLGCLIWLIVLAAVAATPPVVVMIWKEVLT